MDGDTPVIENSKAVSSIADLLSTKSELVEKALLFRTVATGRDVIDKQHTEQEATYGRDAFAKVSWNLLFLHLISCNSGTRCCWLRWIRAAMPVEGIYYGVVFHHCAFFSAVQG